MCPKIRSTSRCARKCRSFDYHINYFHIRITSQAKKYAKLKHCITYRVPICILSNDVMKQKKSIGNHMKTNAEEKTILILPKIKSTSNYVRKCCSFDYYIKYLQIKITSQAKKHTKLKHCIPHRVSVCILSNNVTKRKKSYGNHMKENVEENKILWCPKIRSTSHYVKKSCSFDYHISYFQIRITSQAKKYTKLKHCITYRVLVCILSDKVKKQKSHMVII